MSVYADDDIEEIVVKGKVLYSDQVNALRTPTAIVDVPQAVSIVTDEDIRKQGIRSNTLFTNIFVCHYGHSLRYVNNRSWCSESINLV